MLSKEKAPGERAAIKRLLTQVGFDNPKALTEFVTTQREVGQATLSEIERRKQAAQERKLQALRREELAAECERRFAGPLWSPSVPRAMTCWTPSACWPWMTRMPTRRRSSRRSNPRVLAALSSLRGGSYSCAAVPRRCSGRTRPDLYDPGVKARLRRAGDGQAPWPDNRVQRHIRPVVPGKVPGGIDMSQLVWHPRAAQIRFV